MKTVELPPAPPKERVDKYITLHMGTLSRSQVQRLILAGHVQCNGEVLENPAYKTNEGDIFQVEEPAPVSTETLAENIPLDILYEDDQLIIVNKPAGMAVHPAAGTPNGTLVNALLYHCKGELSGIGGVERPGIVHRLDKGTSGVMVVAKTDMAHNYLSKQFEKRALTRFYDALCYGVPQPTSGEIENIIGRHPKNRKKMAVLSKCGEDESKRGKVAHTSYQLVHRFGSYASQIRLKLHTGRTHQIRVHMKYIHHGVMGDLVYYNRGVNGAIKQLPEKAQPFVKTLSRQMLHASVLGFKHPITKEELLFETPLPKDMQELANMLK
jgi:23S rRNA pseudouridine1911/1915/1917 synthase